MNIALIFQEFLINRQKIQDIIISNKISPNQSWFSKLNRV